ncbi:2-oxoglutarate dehydrogenase complex dihydrolipoyllysine-residue succinyltransferase [Echinicola jeungdonensis]|uniref:Dihydrolipoyllysine-residue succinyltransferase component of 2-oxoglutarate dehydrogenase complex n=1 Tax=Echinicola jeungdonensis TaxID=709343 RepID=A0ABV5J4I1_9BACT|nr:2-oxoglutarate dehydrogenase complex dihydrolipoyllysine-residue succinyltransferase [Echinicola jeungdonensis]MDN3668766.1 2-oxoglutarate dehydrogenase complex dihydrolipoyllysine-residue succinyltransferase [Echinicola jeungdonensis]
MSLEIKVPAVGESISEVTIGQWFKNDGDYVEMDEVICELESDKATFELTAEADGILTTKAKSGDVLEIDEVICEIDTNASKEDATSGSKTEEKESEDNGSESKPSSSSNGGKTGEVKEMVVPTVGESITEVNLASWLKEDGDFVEMDEIIAEVDSDKATFELPAEAQGILRHVAQEGDTLEIGGLICKIEVVEGEAPSEEEKEEASSSASATAPSSDKDTYATGHASPAAAKILAEKGIDAKDVKGTGKDGRITKEDAEKAEKPAPKPAAKEEKKESKETAPEAPKVSGERESRREKMTSLRRTISKRLVAAKNETAMLTTFNEVNMKPIMDLRKQYKEMFKEKHNVNLGFMSFFTKAACVALQEWPAVNAQIDGNDIIYHDFCDVSIAVSAPKGLVVPVIRNAESLSFDQIEKEVVRLAVKARDGKLTIDEMTGGTFTITNGGIFGSMMSTPIINQPQSAILGMHNIVERPMAVNGEVKILPMMYLALSYDHRIIDGRESVSFLVRMKQLLEDPARLLLGV